MTKVQLLENRMKAYLSLQVSLTQKTTIILLFIASILLMEKGYLRDDHLVVSDISRIFKIALDPPFEIECKKGQTNHTALADLSLNCACRF